MARILTEILLAVVQAVLQLRVKVSSAVVVGSRDIFARHSHFVYVPINAGLHEVKAKPAVALRLVSGALWALACAVEVDSVCALPCEQSSEV